MTEQLIELFVNDDADVVGTMSTNGDISADTHEFIVVDASGNLVAKSTSYSVTTAGSSTTPGVVTMHLAGLLDLTPDAALVWRWRRTNAGREKVLAHGKFPLSASFRDAV